MQCLGIYNYLWLLYVIAQVFMLEYQSPQQCPRCWTICNNFLTPWGKCRFAKRSILTHMPNHYIGCVHHVWYDSIDVGINNPVSVGFSMCMQILQKKSLHYIPNATFDPCVVDLHPMSFILNFHLCASQLNDTQMDGSRHHPLTVYKHKWVIVSWHWCITGTHLPAYTAALRHVYRQH